MTSEAENPSADDFFSLAERLDYATSESLAPLANGPQIAQTSHRSAKDHQPQLTANRLPSSHNNPVDGSS